MSIPCPKRLPVFALAAVILSGCASAPPIVATRLTPKEAGKSVTLYDHRSPFAKASTKEVALTSINLRFITGTREIAEKRGAGKSVTWAFLEGIDDAVFQEIADEYYVRLARKFGSGGFAVTDRYKNSQFYKKLADDSARRSRVTFNKNWGMAQVYTANNEPYIEYPLLAFGAHARLGNELEVPVGQILLTIDFAQITQKVSSSIPFSLPHETTTKVTSTKSTIVPLVSIQGPTGLNAMPRGDGSYAFFQGKNWGATNVTVKSAIFSQKNYATGIASSQGVPDSLKRIQSNVLADLASIFSGGAIDTGRGAGEFTFVVNADRELYKAAVLDALDAFDEHLFTMINDTL